MLVDDDAGRGGAFREGMTLASLTPSHAGLPIGTPAATILVHVANVRALARLAVARPLGENSHVPEALVARAVGRVVAHEVGHLLLGPDHNVSGLMVATFSVRHVLASDLVPFALSPRSIATVAARADASWRMDMAAVLPAPLRGR